MTSAQIQATLATLVEQVTKLASASKPAEAKEGTNANTEQPSKEGSPKPDLNNSARMEKFGGGDSAGKDWSFELKVLTMSINPSMEKCFQTCETTAEPLTPENLKTFYSTLKVKPKDLEARSKELFGILCLLTEGEAKVMIRGQTDGLAAYRLLHRSYSRTTLAKTIKTVRDALVPKKAMNEDLSKGKQNKRARET